MSSFSPVNDSSSHDRTMGDAPTPRPDSKNLSPVQDSQAMAVDQDERNSHPSTATTNANGHSSRPIASKASGSEETRGAAAGESDGDHGERDGSENDAAAEPRSTAGPPPSKKKKGQRFFCTDFPPCTLSFTRSEHLARHIRKHTGERPFQCHCSRRFSRLDNLRQHAQTVHVNEDIPGDSLAATGIRFQRQIRTDRVRPQGRARAGTAGTAGSQGTHSRGHSRNLSGSSITSTASSFSQPEIRRRPPPLIMANDGTARTRLAVDTMAEPPSTPPSQIHGIPGPSAAGSPYATPMFVANGGSPHYASPMSTVSSAFWDGRTPTRRLSVPSGPNPFLQHHAGTYPPPYAHTSPYSNAGVYASPTSTHHSEAAGLSAAEAELRRRTWHPSTYSTLPRPVSNGGLGGYQAPETLQPAFGLNGSAEPPPRLPGIESFDKVLSQQRPLTPPARKRTPMDIDSSNKPPPPPPPPQPSYPAFGGGFIYSQPSVRPPPPISGPGHRRGHVSWDVTLHRNLTGLEIADRSHKDASHWGQQTIAEIQNVSSGPSPSYQPSSAQSKPTGYYAGSTPGTAPGPLAATRTSPEDSSSSEGAPTPSTASLEYHPAIVHSSGYVEPHQHAIPPEVPQSVCNALFRGTRSKR